MAVLLCDCPFLKIYTVSEILFENFSVTVSQHVQTIKLYFSEPRIGN